MSVIYQATLPGEQPVILVARLHVVPADTCAWLRAASTLDFDVEMSYRFAATSGGASLSLDQRGRMYGQMHSKIQNDMMGVWAGTTTLGEVALDDSHSIGDISTRRFGSGPPVIGIGNQDTEISGLQLVVDYTQCRYAITGKTAVLATSGEPNDPWREQTVGSLTRGGLAIGAETVLLGRQGMPSRPAPDEAGTYAPGGLENNRLFRDGFATPGQTGEADVCWTIEEP